MPHTHFLSDILVLLLGAVVIVAIFRHLRMSSVLGYLVAGLALGPQGFGVMQDVTTAQSIAELGVVFLLFLIGLELNFERLRAMRGYVFGFGTAQVALSALLLGGLWALSGHSGETALVVGSALALSSTAIVLQVVTEQGRQSTQTGRLALGILLLQDLAVVPLLVLVPLLGPDGKESLTSALLHAGLNALAALVLMILAGRFLMRPLFRIIASEGGSDLFAAATLLVALGASWMTEYFGLSLALGAFLAGVMIAETEYSHQVRAEVRSYKELLMGLFFMTVGMRIDIAVVLAHWPEVLGYALVLILLKAGVIIGLCRWFDVRRSTAIHTGFLLAQGGEFAFILFQLAQEEGVLPAADAQVLLVVITVTMALTPLLALFGQRLGAARDKLTASDIRADAAEAETVDMDHHVVIVGFGRIGQTVAKLLAEEDIGYVAVDLDTRRVAEGRKKGLPVYYGDGSRPDVLRASGIERAQAVVITTHETVFSESTLRQIRMHYPTIPVIARAIDTEHHMRMDAAGANVVIPEAFEASLQIGAALLDHLGTPDHEVQRVLTEFRKSDYAKTQVKLC